MAQTAVQDDLDLIGELISYMRHLRWRRRSVAEINVFDAFCRVLAV